ncbi:MAG: RNA polymerase sigma factor [Actinomycetota bacterium]
MSNSNEEFLRATLDAMDLVYNIARRMVPRREDAEDLVQETYLAAFRAWQGHRRPRQVKPWLATICMNLARSAYRHRSRRPQEVPWEEMAPFASGDEPESEAIAALERRALHRALWALSEEQRTVIALVDLAGFSTRDAARIMGTPRGTVLSRLHRGRRALASLLEGLESHDLREGELGSPGRVDPFEEEP